MAQSLPGSLNPNLPLYASALGETDEALLHYREAEEHLRLAWSVAQKLNGDDHVDAIETEARLGRFYGNIWRYREGVQRLAHAMSVCLRLKGPDDPFFTPQMLLQYGEVLSFSGQLEEGLSYISRAIDNRRKNRPGTRYLAQMLEAQALELANLGENEKAREALTEASAISAKAGFQHGADFTSTQIILAFNSNHPSDALPFIEDAYGPPPAPADSGLSKTALRNLWRRSELAFLLKDTVKAIALARQGSKLVESSGLFEYLKGWEARYLLVEGRAYCMRGDPARALPILKRALNWKP